MCSLAFHAFLRVGEMAVTNNSNTAILSITDVTKLVNAANQTVSLKVTFRVYKHSYNNFPFSIVIKRQSVFCPVEFLLDYLQQRGTSSGSLFLLNGLAGA